MATLYLVYGEDITLSMIGEDAASLGRDLWLVDSTRTRSRLYHGIKHARGGDKALLVAPLADDPKFKGMAPGSLAWLRGRED